MTHQDGPQPYGTGEQPAPPYGQAPYEQPAYGPSAYGQTPYGQAPYGQAPYGQAPYGQAPYPGQYGPPAGYPYAPPQRTNGMAIASMVLGILWLYWIGSILALVFGYMARNQIRERGEAGSGMATAGIVLGWIGVGIFALLALVGIASYS
jgi:hypothetical protein